MFLGKIHYWLFNKIQLTEQLEQHILQVAASHGVPVEFMKSAALKQFEAPLPEAPLEELINHQNIHGWLQRCITQAESRQAFYVTQILEHSPHLKTRLLDLAAEQARQIATTSPQSPSAPQAMFQAVHDHLLEGMPCDRTQQIVENDDIQFAWKYEPCLHQSVWESVGGDVKHYYDLRKSWIQAFSKQLQPSWSYSVSQEGIHQIQTEGGTAAL
ncbi:hypothetical protein [Anoxynatronum sibiricum]|uniref:hypothetical protein n=1 Tax=Anoxynatronum sibiricum TaxID=210623 RepID=UPI0031B82C96